MKYTQSTILQYTKFKPRLHGASTGIECIYYFVAIRPNVIFHAISSNCIFFSFVCWEYTSWSNIIACFNVRTTNNSNVYHFGLKIEKLTNFDAKTKLLSLPQNGYFTSKTEITHA